MLSKIKGRNYVIAYDSERYSSYITTVNKARTDKALDRMKKTLTELRDLMHDTNEYDEQIYLLLESMLPDDRLGFSDGNSYAIDEAIRRIDEAQYVLAEPDDEFPEPEDIVTPEDLGFRKTHFYGTPVVWEKSISETEDCTTDEELVAFKEPDGLRIYRRIRTIHWEKTAYGKSSTSIRYRKIRMNKQLRTAVENALREAE